MMIKEKWNSLNQFECDLTMHKLSYKLKEIRMVVVSWEKLENVSMKEELIAVEDQIYVCFVRNSKDVFF